VEYWRNGVFTVATVDGLTGGAERIFFVTAAHIVNKVYSQNLESVIGIAGSDSSATEPIFIVKDKCKN